MKADSNASNIFSDALNQYRVVDRSRLADQVTHALRELILSHKIPAGAKLVQTDLAEQLGVSRTPLREAIRLLEQDGLVRITNRNGTVEVVRLGGDELRQLYELREVIDGLAARLLARRGLDDAGEQDLRSHLEEMRLAVAESRGEAFFTAHLAFHAAILNHSGNDRLLYELQLVRLTAGSLRDEFPRLVGTRRDPTDPAEALARADEVIAEHRSVFEAIQQGDEDLAEQVARRHIRTSLDLVPTVPHSAPKEK